MKDQKTRFALAVLAEVERRDTPAPPRRDDAFWAHEILFRATAATSAPVRAMEETVTGEEGRSPEPTNAPPPVAQTGGGATH